MKSFASTLKRATIVKIFVTLVLYSAVFPAAKMQQIELLYEKNVDLFICYTSYCNTAPRTSLYCSHDNYQTRQNTIDCHQETVVDILYLIGLTLT